MGRKMSQTGFLLTVVVSVAWLLAFGLWYSRRIYHRPFRPGLTWLSVVLGCEATLAGMIGLWWAVLHYSLRLDRWLALLIAIAIPHGAFILTGVPMILYQLRKDGEQIESAVNMGKRADEEG